VSVDKNLGPVTLTGEARFICEGSIRGEALL
jgi:hypothetical protein